MVTVSDDYAVAALATIRLDDLAVRDTITDVTGDPGIHASGGYVFQTNRYGYDSVRVYEPGSWAAPLTEFALEDLANPYDVDVCGAEAFITQHGSTELAVVLPETGALVDTVDLSAWADADGLPEPAAAMPVPEGLLVSVQNFDRDDSWAEVGGAVLTVDCATHEVTSDTAVATPTLMAWDEGVLIHEAGVGIRAWDEGVGPVLAELPNTLVGGAGVGDKALVVTEDDGTYSVVCADLGTGEVEVAEVTSHFITDLELHDGQAWLAARQHWTAPEGAKGVVIWDIASCEKVTAAPLATTLAPSAISFADL
jgi:hypothetical protein